LQAATVTPPRQTVDSMPDLDDRALAELRVAEAKRLVERQRKVVETHRRRGINSGDAEARLIALERSLAVYEDRLVKIIKGSAG
jgi:hypothetical protein